jgi:cytochrome P450
LRDTLESVLNIASDLQIDLLTPEALRNPHPILAQLRAEAPIYKLSHREMGDFPWVLTRYDDSVNLLKDDRFTKDLLRRPGSEFVDRNDMMMQAAASINRHMLTVDPPDHTRLRGLVHKAFTPKMIRSMESRVVQITNELIDQAQANGHQMDFVNDFALPLPMTVIAEQLGIPASDRLKFHEWTQTIVMGSSRGGAGSENVGTAVLEFIMYFHEQFDKRRTEPTDDLITALVQAEEAGEKLDQQELISMVFLLLLAGHETTVNLLGNGMLALLRHPDQMHKLREHPELAESAVEEMLRYDGPIGITSMRWALDDLEIHGQHIGKGDLVLTSLLAANRDPDVFENPDRFDITRQPNRHIAFGHGIHYCVGAPLARLETQLAFPILLDRLPNLELDIDPDAIEWNPSVLLHGMKSMPVRF